MPVRENAPPLTTRRQFLSQAVAAGAAGALAGCATAAGTPSSSPGSGAVPAATASPAGVVTIGGGKSRVAGMPVPARRTLGANDRVRCGFVGVGNRGSSLLRATLERDDVDVVAVTDTYDVWRDRAVQWCRVEQKRAKGYTRYEDMLEQAELDAVVIATPDHIHAPAALAALDAGKDVYCEKPMTLTAEQAQALQDRVTETGAVFQVGTQLRSMALYQKARDLMQSGALGKLLVVQVNRTFDGGILVNAEPPGEANPTTVHWDLFLRDTKAYPFDARRYFRWREFEEYSNGLVGDLMLHHLDICHFITGCGMPARVMSVGGIYLYRDGRSCADTVSVIAEYSEPFQFNFATTGGNNHYDLTERYLCSEGTLEVRGMEEMSVFRGDLPEEITKSEGPQDGPHLADFFSAVRSRGKTIAPVEAGVLGATVCAMAVRSQRDGVAVSWKES